MQQDGIAYEVFTKNQTRTVDSYCEINKPGSFHVWAQLADNTGALYIDGDEIKNDNPNDGGSWYDATGVRYWPQGKNLNFFAHVNGEESFNYNNGAPKFEKFKVNPTVANQLDLMYSVNMGAVNNGSPVALNFRHALSQVCFKATNKTKNLDVTIKSVSVGHLTDGGTYEFPSATTTGPIIDPDHDDINDGTNVGNQGKWYLDDKNTNEYTADVNGDQVVLKANDAETTKNLTCPEENHKNGWTNVMTVMPQEVQAWDPSKKGNDYNGAYFLLDVVLKDNRSEVSLYTGRIAIPVNIKWYEGYRYIYTFVFNEGTDGGYTPHPDDPQPVLAGITYDVTCDDFIPVNGDDPDGTIVNTSSTTTDYKYILNLTFVKDENDNDIEYDYFKSNSLPIEVPLSKYHVDVPEGYDFLGWTRNEGSTEAEFKADDTITFNNLTEGETNITIWAVFAKKDVTNNVKVSFDDGLGNTTYVDVTTTNGNGEVECIAAPTREHYTFKGWDLNGNLYQAGEKVEFKEPDVPSFTAKWERVETTYTITFDKNMDTQTVYDMPENISVKNSDGSYTYTFPSENDAPRTNNLFCKGWTIVKDGEEITYPNGTTVTLTPDNNELYLYVAWRTGTPAGGSGNLGGVDPTKP